MLLSILIVNYNGKRFLAECLASVRQYVRCEHEVIIVDNASADDSVDYIRSNFPEVKLIASPVNTGFTGGNNLAASAASGELLLLLNNDTLILSDIQAAVDRFQQQQVGAAGVHLCYADRRNQASVGYEHTPARMLLSWSGLSGVGFLPNLFRSLETAPAFYRNDHEDVAWVSGAFLLTRTALWRELAGLDERYFMYVEDVDYCRRVRQRGYRIAYVADVHVLHYEGAGKPWIGEAALMRTMNSYALYLGKYYARPLAWLTKRSLGVLMLARASAYALRCLSSSSAVLLEKRAAYRRAGVFLLQSGPAAR
jgi:N-acetylglucosaminyl-diphospho-decaprenol L-rhamnosyltransferase